MIHEQSTNVVKWILLISLIELALYVFSSFYLKFTEKNLYILLKFIISLTFSWSLFLPFKSKKLEKSKNVKKRDGKPSKIMLMTTYGIKNG